MPVKELDHYFVRANDLQRSHRFYCDVPGFAAHCEALDLPMRTRYFSPVRLLQIFARDPDGLTIELNFHGTDTGPAWRSGGENYAEMPRVESAKP